MKDDDVQKYIYTALIVFVVGVLAWVGFLGVSACGGFTLACKQGTLPVERTPIPTLIPATLPVSNMGGMFAAPVSDRCRVAATDLIGAWVAANSPEKDSFPFVDVNGQNCETNFAEVAPLFTEPNLWSSASLACVSCHSVDVTISPAQLDLSSYAGIMAGALRADAESKGTDILGAGNWEKSLLYEFLATSKADVPGHTEAVDSFVFVGKPLQEPVPTATP